MTSKEEKRPVSFSKKKTNKDANQREPERMILEEHKLGDMNPLAPLGKKIGALPPPPPGTNKSTIGKASKLKRSPQMSNLYRIIREKLENDGSTYKKSAAKKSSNSTGNTSNNAQGSFAAALDDITKRSTYFKKIEEDCIKYSSTILELKSELEAFKTTNMTELLKFHQYVEEHLEKLSDERKVLLRFEDFPFEKLETLRLAAGTYHTLEGIVSSLKGWRFTAASAMTSISDQLNKIDSYFKQIEKKVNTIEVDKEKDANKFRSQNLTFDYNILTRIKEEMVDVSSSCIEITLKESKKAKEAGTATKLGSSFCGTLWQVFQFAYKAYIFAGGQDDRANRLSDELACELQTYIQN